MTQFEALRRRRLLIAWLVCVVICTAALATQFIVQPMYARVIGLRVSTGLAALIYTSAAAICVTTIVWFRAAPRQTRKITVQELRGRAAR
jgi:hypothetical protein